MTRVAWVRGFMGGVQGVSPYNFDVGQKKSVGGVGQNFCMGGVGLKRFVKKFLLKVSQNLQESTCAGVSC